MSDFSDDPGNHGEDPAGTHEPQFGRGWIPAARDIGIPGEGPCASSASGASENAREREESRACRGGPRIFSAFSWDADRKLRFLDHLTEKGDVRAACARVGMSRTSAYLLRRRDPLFADAWQAALVLARRHVEEVLATRALDGVEEAVWFRGELVGMRRRFDARLLLAHLARLDAAAGGHEDLAERFDELLALVAGEDARDHVPGLAEAPEPPPLPPAREDYIAGYAEAGFVEAREAWLDEVDALAASRDEYEDEEDENEGGTDDEALDHRPPPRREEFLRAGAARWDGWQAHAFARVDAALCGDGAGGGEFGAMEYKSLGAAGRGLPSGPCKPCKPVGSSTQRHGLPEVARGRERTAGFAVIDGEGRRGASPTPSLLRRPTFSLEKSASCANPGGVGSCRISR